MLMHLLNKNANKNYTFEEIVMLQKNTYDKMLLIYFICISICNLNSTV